MKTKQILGLVFVSAFAITSCMKEKKVESKEVKIEQKQVVTTAPKVEKISLEGTFFGVLPCASCPGIETTITLNSDGTFTKKEFFQGSKDEVTGVQGNITKTNKVNTLNIDGNLYLLEKDKLTLLTKKGEVVAGGLADKYILKKK